MNKIYTTLCVAMLASTSLFAQKQVQSVDRFDIANFSFAERTPTDTLLPGTFFDGTISLYTSASGYVAGNNNYADEVKAQQFILSNATILEGALLYFGGKTDATGSNITVSAWAMDGTGATTSVGSGQTGPGTMLGSSATVSISDADTTGNFTPVNFAAPFYVGGDFALGIDVTTLAAGDTVGLLSSADGDGNGAELTWERWQGGAWYTMLAAWPLDFDFGILAVVDNSSNGIDSDSYMNGIKADVIPNPAVDIANVVFDLQTAASIDIKIIDINGKIVYEADHGDMNQGRHTINVPVSDLAAGTYYYTIGANGNRLTKKMVVN